MVSEKGERVLGRYCLHLNLDHLAFTLISQVTGGEWTSSLEYWAFHRVTPRCKPKTFPNADSKRLTFASNSTHSSHRDFEPGYRTDIAFRTIWATQSHPWRHLYLLFATAFVGLHLPFSTETQGSPILLPLPGLARYYTQGCMVYKSSVVYFWEFCLSRLCSVVLIVEEPI